MNIQTTELGRTVIGCAMEVHSALGPGLLESAYERCLAKEFRLRGIQFAEQLGVPINYKGEKLDCGYRVDFVVENELVVELKAIDRFAPIHRAQMITYLKLTGLRQGFLFNFNAVHLRDGIVSVLLDR